MFYFYPECVTWQPICFWRWAETPILRPRMSKNSSPPSESRPIRLTSRKDKSFQHFYLTANSRWREYFRYVAIEILTSVSKMLELSCHNRGLLTRSTGKTSRSCWLKELNFLLEFLALEVVEHQLPLLALLLRRFLQPKWRPIRRLRNRRTTLMRTWDWDSSTINLNKVIYTNLWTGVSIWPFCCPLKMNISFVCFVPT